MSDGEGGAVFARFIVGDVFDGLASIKDGTVDLVVTSPPFLALRSYLPADHPDKDKEIGSEATPAEFIDTLLRVTAELRRVLAPHGSICVELGDTYAGSGGGGGDYAYGINPLTGAESPAGRWRIRNVVTWCRPNPPVGALGDKWRPATSDIVVACTSDKRYWDDIATRYPSDYHRPNLRGKGSRATDVPGQNRNTSDHTVNPAGAPLLDWHSPLADAIDRAAAEGFALGRHTTEPLFGEAKNEVKETIGQRMLRELVEQGAIDSGDVLYLPPGGYHGSHYAVYPPALVEPLIKAMAPPKVCRTCGEPSRRIVEYARPVDRDDSQRRKHANGERPAEGRQDRAPEIGWEIDRTTIGWTDCGHNTWRPAVVLDPFVGSGTTLAVATGHGHDAIGIDLDERNYDLALERVGPLVLGPPEKPQPRVKGGA